MERTSLIIESDDSHLDWQLSRGSSCSNSVYANRRRIGVGRTSSLNTCFFLPAQLSPLNAKRWLSPPRRVVNPPVTHNPRAWSRTLLSRPHRNFYLTY